MPQMGESVMEGTVIEWSKQLGDAVEVDETLLEIATDKVDTEVPSPEAGVLVEILVQADETVAVGQPIAVIDTDPNAVPAEASGGSGVADAGSGEGRMLVLEWRMLVLGWRMPVRVRVREILRVRVLPVRAQVMRGQVMRGRVLRARTDQVQIQARTEQARTARVLLVHPAK